MLLLYAFICIEPERVRVPDAVRRPQGVRKDMDSVYEADEISKGIDNAILVQVH